MPCRRLPWQADKRSGPDSVLAKGFRGLCPRARSSARPRFSGIPRSHRPRPPSIPHHPHTAAPSTSTPAAWQLQPLPRRALLETGAAGSAPSTSAGSAGATPASPPVALSGGRQPTPPGRCKVLALPCVASVLGQAGAGPCSGPASFDRDNTCVVLCFVLVGCLRPSGLPFFVFFCFSIHPHTHQKTIHSKTTGAARSSATLCRPGARATAPSWPSPPLAGGTGRSWRKVSCGDGALGG
jgi:hypothetical protein